MTVNKCVASILERYQGAVPVLDALWCSTYIVALASGPLEGEGIRREVS